MTNQRPNIVWLVQDHVVWKHFRDTEGPKPELNTYNRIVSSGMEFTQARTIIPLCAPARGSLVTGVYPHKHGIMTNGHIVQLTNRRDSWTGSFHAYLAEIGYRSGYFGKWHAGEGTAQTCGFEGFSLPGYGDPYSTEEYANYLQKNDLPEPIVDIEWRPNGRIESEGVHLTERGLHPNPKRGIGHPTVGVFRTPFETSEPYFVSRMASDWLEQRAQKDEPFMLRVDVWGPHQPYLVAEPFKDTMNPKDIPEYPNFKNDFLDRPLYHQRDQKEWRDRTGYTTWEEWQPIVARAYEHFAMTDAALGLVLDTLERTGLAENTIVIYTADHGDILASNGGLFDKDSMLTEETMSIPLAIHWPGVTDGPMKSDELVSNMDIVPTILEMAGISVPAHMDGKSMASLLKQTENTFREDLMAQHFGHMNYNGLQRVLYWKNYKYVAHLDDSDELYDLLNDPFENKNLIESSEMKNVLLEMHKRLALKMTKFGDLSEDSKRLISQKQMFGT